MSTVVRFKMSGREFRYDLAEPITLLDLSAFSETGLTDPVAAGQLLARVAGGAKGLDLQAAHAVGAMAYLAAVREGTEETWRQFARNIDPSTLEFLPDEPVKVDDQVAAAAQRAAEQVRPVVTREMVDPHPLFTATQNRQAPPA